MSRLSGAVCHQRALPARHLTVRAAAPRLPSPAAATPPCCWRPAWPQHCRHAAPQRRRQAPQRRVATCSSSSLPHLAGYQAGGGSGASRTTYTNSGSPERTLSDVIHWTINLPWQKAFSWFVVAVMASQLRDFFGITMGTFIVSFVGNGFDRRRFLVIAYYTAIVSLFTLFGVLIIPDVVREGADFVSRLQTENLWVVVLEKMRKGLGEGVMDSLERFLLIASSDDVTRAIDFATLDTIAGNARTQYLGMALQNVLRQYTNAAASIVSDLLSFTTKAFCNLSNWRGAGARCPRGLRPLGTTPDAAAPAVGISLILSFMVVWDLPTIQRGVQSLRTSRVAPIYNTVAPSLEIFATLFGKALQAQARIAAVNTILTCLGMWALQLPGVGLLSLFVFVCGFIPIAGVIISTVPIGFVALTEYGFTKLALVLLMITGVHFVEAYGLNPAIYSAHLKLHPLLVLAVLVVAEHSLGVWSLLLAVPLTVFTLDYVVSYPEYTATRVAAAELENVVAATTWDVHRNIRANDRPVTPEQQAALEEWLADWGQRRSGGGGGGARRRQLRAAYIERIKLLHPDVSAAGGQDTTAEAAALNAAYERLMAAYGTNSRDEGGRGDEEEGGDPLDVFDLPEAEPDRLFVNPFACYNISPLQWEELQQVAREAEAAGQDPWYALQQQGVQCSEAAFVYLSPQQLALVSAELERASAALDATSQQAAAFFLADCLMRARVANNRMPTRASRW
ncbi:hypothetical protein CHLNCDRAFT_52421 [Chlorella variabilis]|uniref:J domain-containing protein n=1 Tax=Chlorella variabilis TaxID=554065 RepID=E1ZF28_CHLVA|nr:hypothetical protein CHLNCDRAFT_52421 [Chlorella variabilis]EFN55763.1 hypothetical protein CHLNCDRAFT_52421 [Chlorella variabilis]|eukprot:XP_005847865.1 hypothetical protein CHLNCDRAFT_52421 [Chlorella variabilis]